MKIITKKKSKKMSLNVKNTVNEDDIRCRAEEIWREDNFPNGHDISHWLQAEEELWECQQKMKFSSNLNRRCRQWRYNVGKIETSDGVLNSRNLWHETYKETAVDGYTPSYERFEKFRTEKWA